MSLPDRPAAGTAPLLEPACRALALLIPLLASALRPTPALDWRADQKLVESLGFVPFAADGVVSSTLAQVSSLLPIGGRLLRAGLAGAAATAFSGWLLYALVRSFLELARPSPRLSPPLALAAVLTALLGPAWQTESNRVAGASTAAALVLFGLFIDQRLLGARRWVAVGMVVGLCAAESRVAALCLLLALGVRLVLTLRLPSRRELLLFVAFALGSAAVCVGPLLLRATSGRTWLELGIGWSSLGFSGTGSSGARAAFPDVWASEAGLIACVLAAAGLCWSLLGSRTRPFAAACVSLLLADMFFGGGGTLLSQDPTAPLRLLAIAGLASGTAFAVHSAALLLVEARVHFAQPAAIMLVVFDFTLALSAMDRAVAGASEAESAAETWTDEALSELPQNSLVLARSPWIAWRLWAARVVRGQRPDVVVVPLPMIGRSSFAASLLEIEPALLGLVREVAINGKPSEYSLSTLADARPLYVELDRDWDRRLIDHLRPNPLWLGFAPHALGRSDRTEALRGGRGGFRRVLAAARGREPRDEATLAVLNAGAREQAVALAAVGDRSNLERVLSDLRAIDPGQAFVEELTRRVIERRQGRVDLRGLLD